jgi:hypothetical protein
MTAPNDVTLNPVTRSSEGELFYTLQDSVSAYILSSDLRAKLGGLPPMWGEVLTPASNVQSTALWVTQALKELFAQGLYSTHRELGDNLRTLEIIAEDHRKRLTPNHLLLELLAIELIEGEFGAHMSYEDAVTYQSCALEVANAAVYEGQSLSESVPQLERILAFVESRVTGKFSHLTEAVGEVRAMLIELELRIALIE